MKSMLTLAAALFAALGLAACAEAAPLRVASDGAQIQRENPAMPTRVAPENGTKIIMHVGDTVIPGVLNDGETAQALVKMLPYKVRVSRYSHDFCGVMDDALPYKEEEVHHGWLNGDIDFATDLRYRRELLHDTLRGRGKLRAVRLSGQHRRDNLRTVENSRARRKLRGPDRACKITARAVSVKFL